MPALEAMACETPVISSDAGALPEVVGDAGLLVNPLDIVSISEAMNMIISDGQIRKNLSLNSKKRIKKYSWKKSARIVEKVIEEIC